MEKSSKIYVAGHTGLAGSAIVRMLKEQGYTHLILKTHEELELTNQHAVADFFESEKPEYVFICAARVGGIFANNTYTSEFIYRNLMIQTNIINSAYENNVKRLIFLGSSCSYPRLCTQPMKESDILTGEFEPTNQAYAIAKIAGAEMCRSYNKQFNTQYLCAIPNNLYGINDTYDLENSHVLPALILKMHTAKTNGLDKVELWGTGTPRRELLYSDDMATACISLMNLEDNKFQYLLTSEKLPIINIGMMVDYSIREFAEMIKEIVGFTGELNFDTSKPDGMPIKLLDNTKLLNTINWKAKTKLKDGIHVAYQDFISKIE